MPGPNEARTRKELIDPALVKAGWDVNNPVQVGLEIPVDGTDPATWSDLQAKLKHMADEAGIYDMNPPTGVCDYTLYAPNGEIVAVVEAKRTSIDPRLAESQTEFYVTEVEKQQSYRPFAFMTNGYDIYFWDVEESNKRLVSGFFSPPDLENLLYIRQNKTPLTETPIDSQITDRLYQQEAIRRVCEAFERGKRKALLVMATGTGKTRVATSLVDICLRANQTRKILFVADRDALVQQAKTDGFEAFLSDEPCTRIYTHDIDTTNRLYVVTLQTLNACFESFSPAFFDLIIFDEVHRSIFNKWQEPLHYFDARMIGLTATPADFIDRNTFLTFDCGDEIPTFLYSYEQAVKERYLVDYDVYQARTKFQRKGIQGADLTEEERYTLIEHGIDPDDLDFKGSELESKVSNIDTLRKQWEEIWDVCLKDESGQLPGKTIIFAVTQKHALRLAEVFEEMHPQFHGMVKVITYQSEHKGTLLETFKKRNLPRIVITVDMLETGVDVPEAVNLVFMKPVHSRIKLEQMIGRGTRCHATCKHTDWLPGGHKDRFLVIDFWDNDFSKDLPIDVSPTLPVLVAIFNTRLNLLGLYPSNQKSEECQQVIADLRAQIAEIPTDSFSVRQVYPEIEHVWQEEFWRYLTQDKVRFLRLKVGPLLRYVPGVDVQAATFTRKVERLKWQMLTGKDTSATIQSIREDVSRLPSFVSETPQRKQAIDTTLSSQIEAVSAAELTQLIEALADQMRFRRDRENTFLTLDLPDFVETRGYIMLKGGTERVYVEEYRRRVEQRIQELVAGHPAIRAIERGEPPDDEQLIDLERALRRELWDGELELTPDNIRKAYAFKVGSLLQFLQRLLDLPDLPDYQDVVRSQFEKYIAAHTFTGNQVRFLRTVESVFLRKRYLKLPDLYEPPLSRFGANAVDRWFTEDDVKELLDFARQLAA